MRKITKIKKLRIIKAKNHKITTVKKQKNNAKNRKK